MFMVCPEHSLTTFILTKSVRARLGPAGKQFTGYRDMIYIYPANYFALQPTKTGLNIEIYVYCVEYYCG